MSSFPAGLSIKPTTNTDDQAGDIETYGIAGITWYAALLLQQYCSGTSVAFDPPFLSLLRPSGNVILDLGAQLWFLLGLRVE